MSIWILLAFLFAVWILWLIACAAQAAVSDARRGIPKEQRRGTSIFPAIPLFPLAFWGAAVFADHFVSPWGTLVVGSIHLGFGVMWGISIYRSSRYLSKIDAVAR